MVDDEHEYSLSFQQTIETMIKERRAKDKREPTAGGGDDQSGPKKKKSFARSSRFRPTTHTP